MKQEKFSLAARIRSFRYALNGIRLLFREEHNARIHLAAAVVAVGAGFFFGISPGEWAAVAVVIGLVFAAEAVNSSVEAVCDRLSPGYDEAVGRAKDLAAGAVLICALAAAVVGLLIFVPKLYSLFCL